LVRTEQWLKTKDLGEMSPKDFRRIKQLGFPDRVIAQYTGSTQKEVRARREQLGIHAVFKMVDTCAAEFEAVSPYYYSTYDVEGDDAPRDGKKVLVIGSGPIRIGQGIEFDYCSVHAVRALKKLGFTTIIANNNPETVSTDFDTSDILYFEPLTEEDVYAIVKRENPIGAIVQVGGQTAIKLTKALDEMGVPILGSQEASVDAAEDRQKFDDILQQCGIPRPKGKTVFTTPEAVRAANELGYPVLLRPSYVLGGQGMEIAYSDADVSEFMTIINRNLQEHPILVDKYLSGTEIEVDAIYDGEDILVPGIMEHIERAGVHSGDSLSVYPTITLDQGVIDTLMNYTIRLAKALDVLGMVNIQYVLYHNEVYVIEVNPRSSRTVPFISKVTGVPMVELAVRTMFGQKLRDMGYGTGLYPKKEYFAVKAPVFSFEKLHNVDTNLGPEMKSTGEVLGIAKEFPDALLKAMIATNIKMPRKGQGVLMTVRDTDKGELLPIASYFVQNGYHLYATAGTSGYLRERGIESEVVYPIDEGHPNVLDVLQDKDIGLVVNTPTRGHKPERDGFRIRRKSVEMNIPCLTSIDTANALIHCLTLDKKPGDLEVINLVTL
jgi:carbamoyl-phosphate synthase large subunit